MASTLSSAKRKTLIYIDQAAWDQSNVGALLRIDFQYHRANAQRAQLYQIDPRPGAAANRFAIFRLACSVGQLPIDALPLIRTASIADEKFGPRICSKTPVISSNRSERCGGANGAPLPC
jgi:hypothetical protein